MKSRAWCFLKKQLRIEIIMATSFLIERDLKNYFAIIIFGLLKKESISTIIKKFFSFLFWDSHLILQIIYFCNFKKKIHTFYKLHSNLITLHPSSWANHKTTRSSDIFVLKQNNEKVTKSMWFGLAVGPLRRALTALIFWIRFH